MENRLERLRHHLAIIDRDVAPVVERYREHILCQRGCSQCCHQVFQVSSLEGAYLRLGLETVAAEEKAEILARAAAYEPGHPCPALSTEGACRLYAYRPRICRKYGIPLWHPDRPEEVRTCELNFRTVSDIDQELILEPQAQWARDWIRLRQELNMGSLESSSIAGQLRTGLPPSEESARPLVDDDRRR